MTAMNQPPTKDMEYHERKRAEQVNCPFCHAPATMPCNMSRTIKVSGKQPETYHRRRLTWFDTFGPLR